MSSFQMNSQDNQKIRWNVMTAWSNVQFRAVVILLGNWLFRCLKVLVLLFHRRQMEHAHWKGIELEWRWTISIRISG
jgi:hypothetical protein